MTCVAAPSWPPGPPAKKLAPPPSAALSAAVRNDGVPYWTAVKVDSTVQPGSGSCDEASAAPGAASAPGLTTRFPLGTAAPAGAAAKRAIPATKATRRPCTGATLSRPRKSGQPPAVGSAPVPRGKAIGWTLVLGLVAWALAGRGLVNYDTLYALVWGRDLTHGTLPDYDVSLAPTPHPLATLVGAILSVLGAQGAIDATIVLAFVFLGALGWVTYRLGSEWVNRAAGIVAAAIILTRRPVLDFGARAYVDVPYLVLVLGALLVETRKPRAGAPVLALLGLAGLIRPEAWLFSGAYLIWLWVGGVRDPRLWGAGRRRAAAVGPRRPHRHRRPAALAHGHPRHGAAPAARHRPGRRPGHRAAAPGRDPARAGPLRRRRRRGAGARLPAPARRARRRGRRRRARRLLRARRRWPADPGALPARAGDDPRRLLRSRRLRLGRAPARPPVAALVGVVRGADARRPRRLHPAAGRPHRQPARRAAHPGRHPGRPP